MGFRCPQLAVRVGSQAGATGGTVDIPEQRSDRRWPEGVLRADGGVAPARHGASVPPAAAVRAATPAEVVLENWTGC